MTYQLETKPAYDGSPLRLLQTTRVTYGGSSWMAEAGTVIEDYPLCRYMWENDFPVISATAPDMMQCQQCRHLFDSSINEYSGSVLIYLKDLIYWYNGSTIRRLRGELELDSFLQKYLIDNKMQVAVAARDEFSHCPACGNICKKEKILGDRSIPLVSSQPAPAPAQGVPVTPAMAATTATPENSQPVPLDPLTMPMTDLPLDQRLEKRFGFPN